MKDLGIDETVWLLEQWSIWARSNGVNISFQYDTNGETHQST